MQKLPNSSQPWGAFFSESATTKGITVRVRPRYVAAQSNPETHEWVWHYHIRIENGTDQPVQLVDRHWHIINGLGLRQEVKGEGVVGQKPHLLPGQSYDYVSGCPLPTASGRMYGTFGMLDAEGDRFEVDIPTFALESYDDDDWEEPEE